MCGAVAKIFGQGQQAEVNLSVVVHIRGYTSKSSWGLLGHVTPKNFEFFMRGFSALSTKILSKKLTCWAKMTLQSFLREPY